MTCTLNTDEAKQQKLDEAFQLSEWAKQFGEVRWRVSYKNGQVYRGKSTKGATNETHFKQR